MKTVGIIGANGYTGSELVRLLAYHPKVSLKYLVSRSKAGEKISDTYRDLIGICDEVFCEQVGEVDILFLCLPHQESSNWLQLNLVSEGTLIVDLGNDFRLDGNFGNREFIYGLPESNKVALRQAKSIANPGCFATAIQLALLPITNVQSIDEVYTTGITGSTGAGQSLQNSTHFSWRNDNISAYKTLTHQHVDEILLNLRKGVSERLQMNFVPWRGDFARGIFTTTLLKSSLSVEELYDMYVSYYKEAPFVVVSSAAIDLKQVINTNKCLINIEKNGNTIAIHSVIDNLLKGASGQAVQNMNIAMGWEEDLGLQLKPIAF